MREYRCRVCDTIWREKVKVGVVTCPHCKRECETIAPDSEPTPPDKDTSKPQMSLVDGGFLAAQAVSLAAGIKNGRKRDDWRGLTWDEATRNQYIDALLRHVLLDFDPVAVANNCMIIWRKDEEAKKNG